jgi:hypothetical protein
MVSGRKDGCAPCCAAAGADIKTTTAAASAVRNAQNRGSETLQEEMRANI